MEMEFRLASFALPLSCSRSGICVSLKSYSDCVLEYVSSPKTTLHRIQTFVHDSYVHLEIQGLECESNLPHVTK